VKSSPLSAAGLLLKKAILVWVPGELPSGADAPPVFGWTPIIRFTAPFVQVALLVLALAGIYPMLRDPEKRERWSSLLLLTASFYAAQILFVTSGRYRLAMMPGLFLLAATFLQWRPPRYREKILSAAGGCLIVALAAQFAPAFSGLAESRTLFAEALYRQARPEAVKALLRDHAAHSNDPARDLCMLGLAEAMTGNRAEAEKCFRQAADAAPEEAEGLMNLGILRSESGRLDEAESLLRQAQKREWDHPETLYNLALVLKKKKQFQDAQELLLQLYCLTPSDAKALNALGRVAFQQGDLDLAELSFLRALELNPGSRGLQRNLDIVRRKRQER
jgi:Flp pilus assembly protein TadD